MRNDAYRKLCETMAKRGGEYPGLDIPEFYSLVEELFTPEEAEMVNAMPRGFNSASSIAVELGRNEEDVARLLETMADKGLVTAGNMGGTLYYGTVPLAPGIFEFQFMRGTTTERDRKLARLIHAYKQAYETLHPPKPSPFPISRVIPVDRAVKLDNVVHTYDQVSHYIETQDPIAVSTCFCRHEAKLVNEKDDCNMPDEVCMTFGMSAEFVISRRIGRKIDKAEALAILKKAEDAGLVHASTNRQDIDFLCNCCPCHSMILKPVYSFPKPSLALSSGFQPVWDSDLCTGCDICVERCPMDALTTGMDNVPEIDMDRCIGCGVCATG
ncbi:MAG: 4Fe-4S binding protein, partial [Deltaproteobacteria bacterium]|nr:4Fe-4S binding protein [Deltaproteobacteria bacterium]